MDGVGSPRNVPTVPGTETNASEHRVRSLTSGDTRVAETQVAVRRNSAPPHADFSPRPTVVEESAPQRHTATAETTTTAASHQASETQPPEVGTTPKEVLESPVAHQAQIDSVRTQEKILRESVNELAKLIA